MEELKNNKIYQTIEFLKNKIQGTVWENHVYVVGGCVRDISMGLEPKDLDIVIDKEYGGIGFATWFTHKTSCYINGTNPLLFPKFGTAKFRIKTEESIKDVDIECVSSRKESYISDSRHPNTVFGTLEEDAKRRDLTINSLYLNISTGELLDLSGKGLEDIDKKIIRTPSSADKIFNEDPLRMLRAIRFATRFGWGIAKDTWIGIVTNAHRLDIVSQERITDELNQILLCSKPSIGLKALYNSGLLGYILPEVKELVNQGEGVFNCDETFQHTLDVLDRTEPILENRLGALFHDIAKPKTYTFFNGEAHFTNHENIGATMTENIMRRMKYSNETVHAVTTIVKNHMRFNQFKETNVPSTKTLRRFHASVGKYLDNVLDVIDADNNSHAIGFCKPKQIPLIRSKFETLKKNGETSSVIKLPINGKDIMETLKIRTSPLIGQYLSKIKDAVLDNPKLTKDECLKLVREMVFVD